MNSSVFSGDASVIRYHPAVQLLLKKDFIQMSSQHDPTIPYFDESLLLFRSNI